MDYYPKLLTVLFVTILMSFFSLNSLLAQEYHFASYNIRMDNAEGLHVWSRRMLPLCNLILYNNFDVFGTQEVYYSQLKDMNKYIGEVYANSGLSREGKSDEGLFNSIFYKKEKFKLIASNTFWLSDTPEKFSFSWDDKWPWVCNWVHLKDINNNKDIWFFNTHLSSTSKKSREKSCEFILNKIKEICPKDSNIILTGDFNFIHTNKILNVFRDSKMLKDSYDSAKYKWTPTGTCPSFNLNNITNTRIDFIWVSKNTEVSRYGVLNNFYFGDKGKSITDLKDINMEIVKQKGYKPFIPSDHYPISIWCSFMNNGSK